MNSITPANARLLAGLRILQAHTYKKFDLLEQKVEALARQHKLVNGSLRLAIDMLSLIQGTIGTNGAHVGIDWAAIHQQTRISVNDITLDLGRVEDTMFRAMECTKEMRELSKCRAVKQ